MLHSEFEKIVGMVVTPEEYEAIEKVYVNSDNNVSKSEFCSFWIRLNKDRIRQYKAKVREAERLEKVLDKLWDMVYKYKYKITYQNGQRQASQYLNKSEKALLDKVGIDYIDITISRLLYDLRCKLKSGSIKIQNK